jgi:hypothetical protein
MKFTPLAPLNKVGRVARALVLVALLIGSLFPTVGGISVTAVASIAALALIIYELGRWIPKIHPVLVVLPIFGILVLHMVSIPPLTSYGAEKMETWYTATLLTALSACLLRDERALLTFCRAWLVASGLLAVITILGFQGGRADGFDSNPIWLARAMATGIVMSLFLVMQRDIKAWVFLGISALLVAGIFATGSRGPILAVGIGAIALVMFTRRHRVRRILGVAIGAGAAYWAVTTLPFFADSRINTLLTDGDTDLSRNIFWSVTPPLIAAHPEGVGVGNWSLVAGAPRQFMYPHNLFLEVFAEYGIWFGAGLLIIVITLLIRLLRRARETPIAILVLALLAAEVAQVSVSGDLNARTFWFLMALAFLVGVRAVIPSLTPGSDGAAGTFSATVPRDASSGRLGPDERTQERQRS